MVDPGGALRSMGDSMRAQAQGLRSSAPHPVATLEASGWVGQRASALHARLTERQHSVLTVADECDRLAAAAYALADEYYAAVHHMHVVETQVRSWLMATPPEELLHFPWASHALPSPGSPRWAAVLADARRQGARL